MISHLKQGKELRQQVGRKTQGEFRTAHSRPSVADMVKASEHDRLPELIPVRHQRMAVSPFSFYRGTAGIMALDLSSLPYTNIQVQAIGDCHLMNFGGFATPERTLVFDANDFDETLPAPWEWDLKRLATSFVLAGRNNQLKEANNEELAFTLVQSYRRHIIEFEQMSLLDLWYMKFDIQSIAEKSKSIELKQMLDAAMNKAQKESNEKILYKTTRNVSGNFEIADQPPLIYHETVTDDKTQWVQFLNFYSQTLQTDRRSLFNQYTLMDVALKVVGVGSVGTRCYVLMMMNHKEEPLFLQVKEAKESVLEQYIAKSIYAHSGQRVVEGQRLVQAASDIFIGWSTGTGGRYFYLRQLRDRKIAPAVDEFDREVLIAYAKLCGRMLARAHAKTGNASLMSGYMGKSEMLDEAISRFAVAYANQTEKDYEEFIKAVKAGII
ncbi:MAG TPA: DUF2252 domain-containing protein [Puia sp.]|nr:DUF2252 domain-containing protein [Puia sp.]